MAFNIQCNTCNTHLGRVDDLVGMTDLVMGHIRMSKATKKHCGSREITVTCTNCMEILVTGPGVWVKGKEEEASDSDHQWELLHTHQENSNVN